MAGTIVLLAGVGATVANVGTFSGCVVALKRLMVGVLACSAYARLPNKLLSGFWLSLTILNQSVRKSGFLGIG
jgi:hypothetical protein